jgi:hypothetical protein
MESLFDWIEWRWAKWQRKRERRNERRAICDRAKVRRGVLGILK